MATAARRRSPGQGTPTLADLRRAATTRSLFTALTPGDAVAALGFVQADPIRSPARAQDLTLRHRVAGYRAGDLERRYQDQGVEEDFFVNYGFVPAAIAAWLHPRTRLGAWPSPGHRVAQAVLAFVREHGRVHPRHVDAAFKRGSVTNYWGGSSSATTHLLDHLHYRGLLRVVGRENGIRVYEARPPAQPVADLRERRRRLDGLIDLLVRKYAPVPSPTLTWLVGRLRLATPQWQGALKTALERAKRRLSSSRVGGVDWYWPTDEPLCDREPDEHVRLVAPFDPVVWDRRRFEILWGWPYRFEAYTPEPGRRFGYYALPVLWRDRVVGWANVSRRDDGLAVDLGYAAGHAPRDRGFRAALSDELDRLERFLG